jgi:hypothetical protein
MSESDTKTGHARLRTSELLARIAHDPSGGAVSLGEIVDDFGLRAFGILLVAATLTAFVPSPVGAGSLAGALAMIVGAQMAWGMPHPWLPRWLRARTIRRRSIELLIARTSRPMRWIERLAMPRLVGLLSGVGVRITGLLLLVHSVILALPIPLTNYPLAVVLLLVAVALVEDDGGLLLAGWFMMVGIAFTAALLSGQLVTAVGNLFS